MTRADFGALVGKRFVVTGASSGIGAAVASCLASAGAELILLGRDRARLRRVADETATSSSRVIGIDFARRGAVEMTVRKLSALRRPFDGLVHCAGAYSAARVTRGDAAELVRLMRVNVEAPIFLTLGLLNRLAPDSDVVFVSSSIVQRPTVDAAYYAASKSALGSLADSLRQEVNAAGTRVTSLFPGRTATPMQRDIASAAGVRYDSDALIQPEDIATLVASLLSLPRTIEVTDVFMRPSRPPRT